MNIIKLIMIFQIIGKVFSLEMSSIESLMKDLSFNPPITIKNPQTFGMKFAKSKTQYKEYISFEDFNDICGLKLQNGTHMVFHDRKFASLVLLEPRQFEKLLNQMECKINDEIYFFNENTNKVYETYLQNNIKIKRHLGTLHQGSKLVWHENPTFVDRRSDFLGIHMKAMTEEDGTWVKIKNSFLTEAPYFPNNGTYDVTDYASGVVMEMFKTLTSQLNFTIKYYLRKDRRTGNVSKFPNGTLIGSGTVGDVFFGRADIIATYPVMSLKRHPYLDFLIPEFYSGGLVIHKQEKTESLDFRTFHHPLTFLVWISVITIAFLTVILKLLASHGKSNVLALIWPSLTIFLGANLDTNQSRKEAYKIIVFVTLFCGNFVWMQYQASLTVDLSAPIKELPFNDLETFLSSSWRKIRFFT